MRRYVRLNWGWLTEEALGYRRSAILVALTVPIPALGAAVAYVGFPFAFSLSANLRTSLSILALVKVGESLLAAVWTVVALGVGLAVFGRPSCELLRGLAGRWLGLQLAVSYRPRPQITRMATGYWWNGYEYFPSEREARWQARLQHRGHDPQYRRDAVWVSVATVVLLPVAAVPIALLGATIFFMVGPSLPWWAVAAAAISLGSAPFAWRTFRPLASRFLGQNRGIPTTWRFLDAIASRFPIRGLPTTWRFLGAIAARLLGERADPRDTDRIAELEMVRADLSQTQAAELERIERSLHDGAQARLVALGLSLSAAERFVDTDPGRAKATLREARSSSAEALAELRSLVRGINPPVLTERGLMDAVRALALDAPVPVRVGGSVPARPERPIESAVYFSVSELLTNVSKHAHATRAAVDVTYDGRRLAASVRDDGIGGAATSAGSGLEGVRRRIAAFGGQVDIDSPAGGPTQITVTVPCVLS